MGSAGSSVQNDGGLFLSKTGYDEEYARMSPGHALTLDLLDHLEARGEALDVDFGNMSEATAHWADSSYAVGTVLIGKDTAAGQLVFAAMRAARSWKKRLKRGASAPTT